MSKVFTVLLLILRRLMLAYYVIIVPIFHDPGSTIIVFKIITHRRLYLRRVCLSDVVYYFLARKEIDSSIYIYNLIPV